MSVLKSLHTDCPYQFTYANAKPSVTVCSYACKKLASASCHNTDTLLRQPRTQTDTMYEDYIRDHTTYSILSISQLTDLEVGTIVSDLRLHADRRSFRSILRLVPW
jgi:hypothetical protein